MHLSRRHYLVAGGATLATLAGCSTGSGTQGSGTDEHNDAGTPETDGPLTLEFGESAVFTNDEGIELVVTPTEARSTEAIVTGGKEQVYADGPDADDALYLLVTFRLENTGSQNTKVPGGLFFRSNGSEVERTITRLPGERYDDIDWVDAGDTATGTVVFEVPEDAESGAVAAKFRTTFNSPPVRWEFDLDDIPREAYDFDELSPGEAIELGTEENRYSFAALGATETTSYDGPDGEEHAAGSGKKFVLVEVESENVGESTVTLPTAYNMRLRTDDDEIQAGRYRRGDDRYDGGPHDAGGVRTGLVLFEVPDSASSYSLQVEFGNGPTGTWELE